MTSLSLPHNKIDITCWQSENDTCLLDDGEGDNEVLLRRLGLATLFEGKGHVDFSGVDWGREALFARRGFKSEAVRAENKTSDQISINENSHSRIWVQFLYGSSFIFLSSCHGKIFRHLPYIETICVQTRFAVTSIASTRCSIFYHNQCNQ